MAIPAYDDFYRAVLEVLSDGAVHNSKEVIAYCAEAFRLSEEDRSAMLPSERQTVLANRVGWARTYLKKAGLISSPARGKYEITKTGKKAIQDTDARIDNDYLLRYKSFQEFIKVSQPDDGTDVKTASNKEEDVPENTSYGYGDLEDKLIGCFKDGSQDFETANELLLQGADLNTDGPDEEKNILSEIIMGYPLDHGQDMLNVIRWFLDNGFDVNRHYGKSGARCLWSLTLSTYDSYIIEATKILFNAGAKNVSINDDESETPWSFIATEGSYQNTCIRDYHTGNIYEAVYQIYQAIEDGRPYKGIDSYEKSIGKKILKVLADPPDKCPIFFDLDLPNSKHNNCYRSTLYFVYENGVLISTQYADFWVDDILPDTELIDVSGLFQGIVGAAIKGFSFDHNMIVKATTHYGQPITIIEMDNNKKLRITINFGEVDTDADRAAYFAIQ